jgi:hypothetical protein
MFKLTHETKGVPADEFDQLKICMPVEHRKVVKDVISLGYLKMQQHNKNAYVLSMG